MKILHVIPSLNPADGGPPRVALRLAAGAASLGHKVTMLYHDTPAARAIEQQAAEILAGDVVPLGVTAIAKALSRIPTVPVLGHRMTYEARMLLFLDYTWPEFARQLVTACEKALHTKPVQRPNAIAADFT